MADHVCPWWLGYVLLNPLRRLLENPKRIFAAHVRAGMTVLEVGPGMGYFTLPLARLVGPEGRVVAVDVQPRMLAVLRRRADRAGLAARVEAREVAANSLGIDDLAGLVDVVALLHVVHEVPDPAALFAEVRAALAPGGRVVFVEPSGHVSSEAFETSLRQAAEQGLEVVERKEGRLGRSATLVAAVRST